MPSSNGATLGFNRSLIVEVDNPDHVALLTDAIDASDALFDTHRVPREVVVDQSAARLQIQCATWRGAKVTLAYHFPHGLIPMPSSMSSRGWPYRARRPSNVKGGPPVRARRPPPKGPLCRYSTASGATAIGQSPTLLVILSLKALPLGYASDSIANGLPTSTLA